MTQDAKRPLGMPDPELPWPWKTAREREQQAATAYWQRRFKRYPELYGRWILKGENSSALREQPHEL